MSVDRLSRYVCARVTCLYTTDVWIASAAGLVSTLALVYPGEPAHGGLDPHFRTNVYVHL